MGHRRRWVGGQHQVVATGGAGDGDVDLACIDVRGVVGGQGHVHGARQLAGRDGDHRAIGQGDAQVAGGRLRHRGGVGQHAARFGDGRGRAQGQGGGLQHQAARVVRLSASILGQGRGGHTQAGCWEANGRRDAGRRCIQHHETMAATRCACARRSRPCCGSFQVGGRVGAGSDGLLQLGNRRRGLGSGLGQVEAGVRRVGAPLGFTAQVQCAAVGQFQANGAREAGVYLIPCEQSVAFDKYTSDSFWRNDENLANNAFDDGNNTAH